MEVVPDNEKDEFESNAVGRDINDAKTIKANNPKVNSIELYKLIPYAKHPFRTYKGERLEKLADSIKETGLKKPIVVRPVEDGKFEILRGHNHVKAVKLLGWNAINAVIKENISEEMAERIAIESNLYQQSFVHWKYSQQFHVIKMYSKYYEENSRQEERNIFTITATRVHSGHKSDDKPKQFNTSNKISKLLGISSKVFEKYRNIAKLDDEIINILGRMLDEKKLGLVTAYRISQLKPLEILTVLDFIKNDTGIRINGSSIRSLHSKSKDCKDDLTDHEIKKVLLSNMLDPYNQYIVDSLLKNGIDILGDYEYKNTKSYRKIKNNLIMTYEGFMTLDEFIERYLLNEYQVAYTYESIYDMGNTTELNDDELEYTTLAKEIIEIMKLPDQYDSIEFAKIFTRKGGYIEQLKTYINLDLDLFDDSNAVYKREKCKILYFMYMLREKYFPKNNVLKLLSEPSMESIDNSILGYNTYNGAIIKFIKHSLEKELSLKIKSYSKKELSSMKKSSLKIKSFLMKKSSLDIKSKIKKRVYKIIYDWDRILENAVILIDFLNNKGYQYDYKKTISLLTSDIEKLHISSNNTKYEHSPIETFYLKIIQHECIGNIKNISDAIKNQIELNDNISTELADEMRKLHNNLIDINNIEKYIDDNVDKIARYVYMKEKTSTKERNEICKNKQNIYTWLNFCIRAKTIIKIESIANELLVISFLQVLLLDKQKINFEHTFFGYQNHDLKHPIKAKTVFDKRNEDKHVADCIKIYWVNLVMNRLYLNLGRYESRIEVNNLNEAVNNILEGILSNPSLDEMLTLHQHFIKKIRGELITTVEQIRAVEKFECYLESKGFRYIDENYMIRYSFLFPPEISDNYNFLIHKIDNTINDNTPLLHVIHKTSTANGEKQIKLDYILFFDYQNKECKMFIFDLHAVQ